MKHFTIDYVDPNKCVACEECHQVCPHNCFTISEIDGKIVSNFNDSDVCDCCGKCLITCKEHAIVLKEIESSKHAYIVDPQKCTACEHCVKITNGGFEIIEEDGNIFAKMKDHEKAKAYYFHCPNDAIVYVEKKSIKKSTKKSKK
jgi:ferredoxin